MANVEQWLEAMASSLDQEEKKLLYIKFLDLYSRKLWHQLTIVLLDYTSNEPFGELLVQLYENFILSIESKLNQLRLAQIMVTVAKRYSELAAAIEFLTKCLERIRTREAAKSKATMTADIPQARVFCECELASLQLRTGFAQSIKSVIESSGQFLDNTIGVESIVYSSHYRLQLEFAKAGTDAEGFYKNSLLYLAYTPLDTIPQSDQGSLAFDLCLAALVGETIYNFGDLLTHKILGSIGDDKVWIVHILKAFSAGNIERYEKLVVEYADILNHQPILVQQKPLLAQKMSILGLIELIFQQTLHDRTISFETIAKFTKLPIEDIEFLLIKSLSLKLIRGTIDQVSQTVFVSWVQPRILDLEQIGRLRDQLGVWSTNVSKTLLFLEQETPELIV